MWHTGFLVASCELFNCGHVGSSSLIRDETQAPCIGSAESQSLDHQGCPRTTIFFFLRSLFKNQNWSKETRGTIKAPEKTTDVSLLLIESGLFIEKKALPLQTQFSPAPEGRDHTLLPCSPSGLPWGWVAIKETPSLSPSFLPPLGS